MLEQQQSWAVPLARFVGGQPQQGSRDVDHSRTGRSASGGGRAPAGQGILGAAPGDLACQFLLRHAGCESRGARARAGVRGRGTACYGD